MILGVCGNAEIVAGVDEGRREPLRDGPPVDEAFAFETKTVIKRH